MDLERAFLALIGDVESLRTILKSGVRGDHFADPLIGEVIDEAVDYFVRSGHRSAYTRELIEMDRPDRTAYIIKSGWPLFGEIEAFEACERLITKYRRNAAQRTILETGPDIARGDEEAIAVAADRLSSILRETAGADSAVSFSDRYTARRGEYLDRVTNRGKRFVEPGVPLGWPELNAETGGLRPGEFATVSARTGYGKSWTLDKIALMAAATGHRVALFSLENSLDETLTRLDCLVSGVPLRAYEEGRLTIQQLGVMQQAHEFVASMSDRLLVWRPRTRAQRTLFELYSRAREHGAELVVGDPVTWVTMTGRYRDGTDEMGQLAEDIAQISAEFQVASVWATQFNRNVKGLEGVGTENVSQSDKVGHFANLSLALVADQEMLANELRVLKIIKARRAATGQSWIMRWSLRRETDLSVIRQYSDGGDTALRPAQ